MPEDSITKYYGNTKEKYLNLRQGFTEMTKIKVMEVITSNLVTLRIMEGKKELAIK